MPRWLLLHRASNPAHSLSGRELLSPECRDTLTLSRWNLRLLIGLDCKLSVHHLLSWCLLQ